MATDYSNGANRKAVLAERYNNQIERLRMQDQTSLFNKVGEHVATPIQRIRWSVADRGRPARSDGVLLSEQGSGIRSVER